MNEFKKIENIAEILSLHYKHLSFLKTNKKIKKIVLSMPPDLKHKLIQKGVVCDAFYKYDEMLFRIRVSHNALAQDLRNDSTKNSILNHIKLYKKYNPNEFNNLSEKELIINHNKILQTQADYEAKHSPTIILKDIQNTDFNNLMKDEEHYKKVQDYKESLINTNAKIKSLSKN